MIETSAEAFAKAEELRLASVCGDEEIVKSVIDESANDAIRELAREALLRALRGARRAETLEAERVAAFERVEEWKRQEEKRSAEEERKLAEKKAEEELWNRRRTRGTPEYAQWTEETEEGRRYKERMDEMEVEYERREAERALRLRTNLEEAMAAYEASLKMQWTENLLASALTLPDGRVTTWGDATVADHEARREMFLTNAQRNTEGAARHEAAIMQLEAAGVMTLRELLLSDQAA